MIKNTVYSGQVMMPVPTSLQCVVVALTFADDCI